MSSTVIDYSCKDHIAEITIDDGKVNAISTETLTALGAALSQAEADNAVVIITGRPGIFSAGFDLKQLALSREAAVVLLRAGAQLCRRILSFPFPVITACTGHAYPMGAFIMMSADYRLGVEGPFKIGMNEVFINMTVPKFAVELARGRLNTPYFNRTVVTGEMFSPSESIAAGFLDEVVVSELLMSRAREKAEVLRGMQMEHHHATKLRARGAWITAIERAIEEELIVD